MTCPICGKPTVREFRPFCSGRCADVDLGKWLSGAYAVPSAEEEAPAGTALGDGAPTSPGSLARRH